MKILVISFIFPNSQRPNQGIFVLNRLKALSSYVEIKVVNPIAWSPIHSKMARFKWASKVPEKEIIEGIEVFHPRFFSIPGYLKSIESLSYYLAVKPLVKQIHKDFDFDLIDLHWTYPDLPTGSWLANKYNSKLMVTLRGMEAFHHQDGGVRKRIISHYLKKTDRTISLSTEMAQFNEKLIGPNNKTRVIRNGVDTKKFHYIDKQECRQYLGLDQNDKIILGVGSLIKRKGFDLVISALKEIDSQLGNVKYYILGSEGPEGDFRASLKSLIDQHTLQEKVVFQGQVPNSELIYWYNAADVYCLSSRGEGSPNVLTEALACGCPSVATGVGAVPDIMASEKGLGMLVENENIEQLQAGIKEVLGKRFNRQQLAENFKKYDWDWCAAQVYEVYREIL